MYSQIDNNDNLLDEVIIDSNRKKKIIKYRTKGFPFYGYLFSDEFQISSVQNLPEGKIKTVVFNFNNQFSRIVGAMIDEIHSNYFDVKFGIMLFEMNNDKSVGGLISDSDVTFIVDKNHKGNYRVDVSTLDFPSKQFYLGLKVLSKNDNENPGYYLMMTDNDKDISYEKRIFKVPNSNEILTDFFMSDGHLKMTLEIEQ